MDTKLATQQLRLGEWANIIHDRTDSGLTIREYCKQHGLSRNAYFYWLRRVKAATLTQAGFVEISQPIDSETSWEDQDTPAQLMVKIRDAELCITEDTPAELISRVITVIRSAE